MRTIIAIAVPVFAIYVTLMALHVEAAIR